MPGIGISNAIPFNKGVSWSSYWSTLISATVENAAPTHVVLTFPTAADLNDTDFTIEGFTISSASWTGAVLTLVLSEAVIYFNRDLTITFGKTSETATVTNNVADDGNTVGWYDIGDGSATYMTKDGSNFVSQWNDLSGSSHPLLQAAGTNQPLYQSTGILFDGIDNFLKTTAFTLNQPLTYYLVFKQIGWNAGAYIFDGNNTPSVVCYQKTSTPRINLFAGSDACIYNGYTLGVFGILTTEFNGANSFLQHNANAAVTGNPGANNAGGFKLNGGVVNMEVKELIIRKVADDSATNTIIRNYLNDKYSIY